MLRYGQTGIMQDKLVASNYYPIYYMFMDYENQIISAVRKVMPAVVNVVVAKDLEEVTKELPFDPSQLNPYEQAMLEDKLRHAPRDEDGRIKVGGGSGFIISSEGVILTNKHVVTEPHAAYSILTTDGKKHSTKVLSFDPINDIAILKIDGKNLPTVPLARSPKLELGQTVIAIGNALGEFSNSVSTGVVSGLSRLITATTDMMGHQEKLRGLIQTDAAINPGNSGGPLINMEGEAIGINAAIVFGAQNIGFAIPIERARRDLEEIKKFGHIRRPFLGIRYLILNPAIQQHFQLPIDHGALIVNEGVPGDVAVIPGSAADKAGFKEFDVVLTCNDKKISEEVTLDDILAEHTIGDTITMKLLRNGKEISSKLTLEEFKKPAQKMDTQEL